MDKRRAFLDLLRSTEWKLSFTDHFILRAQTRNIGSKLVEEFVLYRTNDLVLAEEEINENNKTRYKLYYEYGRRKILFIVLDVVKSGVFIVVTALINDKRLQLRVMRNAREYARLTKRLR